MNDRTRGNSRWVWTIYFVGFDETSDGSQDNPSDASVEPHVGYERIETTGDEAQQRADAELAALLRGGQLLLIVEHEDEQSVAAIATAIEKQILRLR